MPEMVGWLAIWRLPVMPRIKMHIWKLPVMARIKMHIWKLPHGKLPTGNYLYNLNIGRNNPCPLCGLEPETAKHLFSNCSKNLGFWQELFVKLGLNANLIPSLSIGSWLLETNDSWAKALIAIVAGLFGSNDVM